MPLGLVVQNEKITKYLLVYQPKSDKSGYLALAGYNLENWELLKNDIIKAVENSKAGDIDPQTLPLSKETISHLEQWAEIYDAKLNWDDPNSSGFPSLEAKIAFEAEGISLWKQLQKELAPNYEVVYFRYFKPGYFRISPDIAY